jgi:hypothetical protein
MKHDVDLIPVQAGNQPTRVLCGEAARSTPDDEPSTTSGMIGGEP